MDDSNRVFVLGTGVNRFLRQWDEEVIGPANVIGIKKDYSAPPKPDQLQASDITYCSSCGITWLRGNAGPDAAASHPSHHTLSHPYAGTRRSIIIHTDGACSNNGKPGAAAGIGIYFGPDSKYNISAPFQPVKTPTNQSAELHALLETMKIVRQEIVPTRSAMIPGDADKQRFRLILATDSSYAVECICKHWKTWTVDTDKKVLLNKDGKAIANSDLLLTIEAEVDKLSRVGVQVAYHHVGRENNRDADRLAKAGIKKDVVVNSVSVQTGFIELI